MWLRSVAVVCRTSDREVAGSTPVRFTASNDSGQVVYTSGGQIQIMI